MPWIIDYDVALEQLRQRGFRCNYFNSGAFGFADPAAVRAVGWVGPPDETIREAVRPLTRPVPAPYEENLARTFVRFWREHLGGRLWAMPMSHWAYELNYGSRDWLPALIENIDLDPGLLEGRNTAAPIEFGPDEARRAERFVQRLLEMLLGSDFMLVPLAKPVLCTLHHHKQLWWQTTDPAVLEAAEEAVRARAGTE